MRRADLAVTGDEAMELLAYLLASAHSCLYDPPGYGTYRLASAAERLSRVWEPRASEALRDYLRTMAERVDAHEWDPMGRAPETEAFLNELLADLARLARDEADAPDA
jgi:hypothetical protein